MNGYGGTIASLAGAGYVANQTANTTATLTIGGASSATFSGPIIDQSNGEKMALAVSGSGTQTLSGSNTYSGGTTITAGTLTAGSTTALGAATGSLVVNGGTLNLNGYNLTVGDLTSGSSSTTGIVTNTSATQAILSVGGAAGWDHFYGSLKDSGAANLGLTLIPPASGDTVHALYLYNSADNYSGPTQMQAYSGGNWATLLDSAANALSPNSAVSVGTGSYLDMNGNSGTIASLSGLGLRDQRRGQHHQHADHRRRFERDVLRPDHRPEQR